MADSFQSTGIAVSVTYSGVSALGKLQDSSASETAGYTAEGRDENGAVKEADRGDLQATVEVTYIPYDGKTFPAVGDIVEVGGFDESRYNGFYYVTDTGETQNQQDYPSKPLSLIRYLDNGVPSGTTTTTT